MKVSQMGRNKNNNMNLTPRIVKTTDLLVNNYAKYDNSGISMFDKEDSVSIKSK